MLDRRIDFDLGLLVHFRQDRDGTGRGVDPALGFRFRYPLHAVRAGLEFEFGVDRLTFDPGDHLFIPAVLASVFRQHLDAPALTFGCASVRIH